MKIRYLIGGLAGVVLLAGCDAPGDAPPPAITGPILTEQGFREVVVGKQLTGEGFKGIINADGTLTGQAGGNTVAGTWEWRDRYWCRVITTGGTGAGEDCQTWELTDNGLKVTRNKGAGESLVYTAG